MDNGTPEVALFKKLFALLPTQLHSFLATGDVVVAGGSLFREMVQNRDACDIDIFCLSAGVHREIREILGVYEIATDKDQPSSSGANFDPEVHSRWYQIGNVVLDVVPFRPVDGGPNYIMPQAIIANFDINVSQFATDFDTLFCTEAALVGLTSRSVRKVRETPTTDARVEKYKQISGWYDARVGEGL